MARKPKSQTISETTEDNTMTENETSEDIVTEVPAPSAKKAPAINLVTLADGSQRNFGERGKLLSSHEVNETGFDITFHVVDGNQVNYSYKGEVAIPALLAEMAAFGVSQKVKASTAGEKLENLAIVVANKVKEITEGTFVSRTGAGETVAPLTLIQKAYAIVNGIDVATAEGLKVVTELFSSLSKEDKSALYARKDVKKQLLILKMEALDSED